MDKKFLVLVPLVVIFYTAYCPLFPTPDSILVGFENHIAWAPELVEKWKVKVITPLATWFDITPIKDLNYLQQKDMLDQHVQDLIVAAKDPQTREKFVTLESEINKHYNYLNQTNLRQKLSTAQEDYPTRYYLIPLEKKFFGQNQQYFEVTITPGEKKEIKVPVKGPIIVGYLFTEKSAEEFFRKYGIQKYLNSKYGNEQGLQKVVYDAVEKRKLAVETLFPEPPSSRKDSFFDTGGEAGKSIPLTSFVGGDRSTLTKPLLAAGGRE